MNWNYKYNRYKLFWKLHNKQRNHVDYILENNHLLKMIMRLYIHFIECIQDRDYIEFKETIEAATQGKPISLV